jgi:carbon storage regulator CsrA
MLVLSRRPQEKILLPNLGTSIEILGVKGDRVRLGIEAPPEIKVLRDELASEESSAGVTSALPFAELQARVSATRQQRHQIRNQLNLASVGLALVSGQLQAGIVDGAKNTLEKLRQGIEDLGAQVESLVASPPARPAAQTKDSKTALLVEDDDNECELLAGFFRLAGYQVATAGDGADAIDYLHDHEPPDVMLLDMMLPRCDGPTTIRMLRRDPALADLKIYAVSGYTPEEVGLDRKMAGVDRWFQKPLNPEVLLRELDASRCVQA